MKYKTIILMLLLTASCFGQSLLLLFDDAKTYIYDGSELITNSIDRDMEVGSDLVVNGNMEAALATFNPASFSSYEETLSHSTERANSATHSLKAKLLNTATNLRVIPNLSALNGLTLKVSFYLYLPSGQTLNSISINARADGVSPPGFPLSPPFTTTDAWTSVKYTLVNGSTPTTDRPIYFDVNGAIADSFYMDDVSIKQVPYYASNGNHIVDSSSVFKYANSYSTKITASAAGDATTNFGSLASTKFTAVTVGKYNRFQVYGYTETADVTLTFVLGDITLTENVQADEFGAINFDFKATASTTGNIKLYLNKAASVYLDSATLKQGR